MLKKILAFFMFVLLLLPLCAINVSAETNVNIEPESNHETAHNTTSNYYTQVDDTTKIAAPSESVLADYIKVASYGGTTLYLDRLKLNIAVKLSDGYIFYSDPTYYGYDIKAYLTTGGLSEVSSTLTVNGQYSWSGEKNQKPKITYDFEIENGFKATLNFDTLGIIINLYVTLDENGNLRCSVPDSEIEENGYVKVKDTLVQDENGKYVRTQTETTYNFALSAFYFFQYFGCVGYDDYFENKINGYDFIADGSGALSRFQYERTYSTGLTKRIYGDDVGIKTYTSLTSHLSDDINISIPVYGVVHGYNQDAFMATIESGDGEAEIVLEPFGYYSRTLQTTYYKFYTRESYSISLATSESGSTTTLPSNRYGDDYIWTYSFLQGDDANYSGMAKYYRENYLHLDETVEESASPLGLNVLAQDYKKGLFGKNFIKMTTYKELLDIIKILENEGVGNFSISYLGWNRGGYYNNKNYKPRVSYNLGSTKSFKTLINYCTGKGYNIESCIDLLTSYTSSKKGVVKKTNLDVFSKYSDSSLFDETYLLTPVGSSENILKYNKNYSKLNISSINLGYYSLNNFQYRYKGTNYSRDVSISQAREELMKVSDEYDVSLTGANSYMYDYISRFYDMETNATGYTYLTDSVPFVSLVLSGYVELFSKEINFEADYDQMALRLVEYNIYPYFTITDEDSSNLRYTNSEYLYTSEFSLWKDDIVKFYSAVSGALNNVIGASMVSHEYVKTGVAKVTYSNGVTIYVNHNNTSVTVDGLNLSGLSYEVVK